MLEQGIATSTEPLPALRNPEYLARAANRHRQKMRPAEPTDLEFEVNEDHIPEDFLKSDVKIDGRDTWYLQLKTCLICCQNLRHGILMELLK